MGNLVLTRNKLTQIEASIFSRMTQLSVLDLSNNNLISIERQSFLGTLNLEEVYLGNNPISSILPSYVKRLCSTNPKCRILI